MHAVESTHVNDWLSEVSGLHVTAKDFRTWHGSVRALGLSLEAAARIGAEAGEGVASQPNLTADVVTQVARHLGNTPAVCRKSYIHPAVLALLTPLRECASCRELAARPWVRHPAAIPGLSADERRLLALIDARGRRSRPP